MKADEITAALDRLRADLQATNAALIAVLTSMPLEAQRQALKAFAEQTVMREQTASRISTPAVQAAMQQVLEAERRLYSGLEGAHKMRAGKLEPGA